MAKTYNPDADYVCISGNISLKGKGNNRIYVQPETVNYDGTKYRFKLSHLRPWEIAFLVENIGTHMAYADWLKTPEGKIEAAERATAAMAAPLEDSN